jgi:hypothetical protein
VRLFRSLTNKHRPANPESEQIAADNLQDDLPAALDEKVSKMRSIYDNCFDVIFRDFWVGGTIKAALIYINGLSNVEELDRSVLSPLMQQETTENGSLHEWLEKKLPVANVRRLTSYSECVERIAAGHPVIFIEHQPHAFSLALCKWEKRALEEPVAESVVRGPREGFTETVGVNTSLLRRKIKTPSLKMQAMTIGRQTHTEVITAYIEGIADKTLIEEVTERLSRIDMDGVLDSGYLEEMIADHPFSPFPQTLATERLDVAAAGLLEGRAVILVDGSPFALIVPTTLFSLLQTVEDYYENYMIGTLTRWLRYFFALSAVLLPSLYVAVLTFHQEMVPTTLLSSIAKSREDVPFPAVIEAFLMEITFEGLREAGIRLPKQIGAAVSIVGALVIGDAAVSAGLVSAPMVMVVAITGIASFLMPRYSLANTIRMLRFPIMLLAGILGLLGIMLAIITVVIHLSTIRSFGTPYLAPIAPMKMHEMKDVFARAPWWMLGRRPRLTGMQNKYRQPPGQKPGPQRGTD